MVVSGRVRRFDIAKGYGFVMSDECKGDIFLHVTTLHEFGHDSIAPGALVRLRIELTDKGWHAVEVLEIQPGDPDEPMEPLEPACVRWFDPVRGFGFVNRFGQPGDVYLHAEVLRRCGFGEVAAGTGLAVRVVEGPKGPMVVEARSWDDANRRPPRGRRREPHRPIVVPTGRSPWTVPAYPELRALVAILEMLRASAPDEPHRWR
jgi:CspA family cold shock protein